MKLHEITCQKTANMVIKSSYFTITYKPTVVVIKLQLLKNQGILPIIILAAMPIKMKVGTHSSVAF
jgi:hypothetical protein